MLGKDRREICKESLSIMKTSLISTYDLQTSVEEEKKLIAGWKSTDMEYVVFSDYRQNEGKRRLRDIAEVIDSAIEEIDRTDGVNASVIYLETLKTVALYSKWRRVLEESNELFHHKPSFHMDGYRS